MSGVTGTPAEQALKIEIGTELSRAFEEKKQAVYDYIAHVYGGGDPLITPDNESWYKNLAVGYAHYIVNKYRESQGIPPNPYGPQQKVNYKAFDRLRECDGWMPSSELRRYLRNAMVESSFTRRELEKYGWKLEKQYVSGKPFYKLVRVPIEVPA